MARRVLLLACFLAAACAIANAQTPEAKLKSAMLDPKVTSYILTDNVILTSDLPAVPDNKAFSLTGALNGGTGKVTISGAKKFSLFQNGAAPVTLSLNNLIITAAKAKTAAVTLTNLGTKLTISNVDFKANPQALSLTSVDAVISRSSFSGHTLGAIDVSKDEGDPDVVKIISSTFTNNKSPGLQGGGAINAGKYTTVDISASTFTSNSASYRGGAVRYRESSGGTITSSTFTSNTAREQGGAITIFNAQATITGCTFKNNVAQTGPGGAIRVGSAFGFGGLAVISSSTFDGNSAPKSFGGAFVMDTDTDETDLNFCKTTFTKNTAGSSKALSNGFIIGAQNFLGTAKGVTIPAVKLDTGASLNFTTITCN